MMRAGTKSAEAERREALLRLYRDGATPGPSPAYVRTIALLAVVAVAIALLLL